MLDHSATPTEPTLPSPSRWQVALLVAVLITGLLLLWFGDSFLQHDHGMEFSAEAIEAERLRLTAFWLSVCLIGTLYVAAAVIRWVTRNAKWGIVEWSVYFGMAGASMSAVWTRTMVP